MIILVSYPATGTVVYLADIGLMARIPFLPAFLRDSESMNSSV